MLKLKFIIKIIKIYIILKLLTFGEDLVFSAKVTRETVRPLVLEPHHRPPLGCSIREVQ
jgi:hypothetical protein